jgi:hypothetical protein
VAALLNLKPGERPLQLGEYLTRCSNRLALAEHLQRNAFSGVRRDLPRAACHREQSERLSIDWGVAVSSPG